MTNYQTTTTVAEDSDNSTKKQECWIGVDLGAANLRFAVAEPAKGAKDEAFVRVLPNTDGKLFVPSILTVEKGGQERVVGSRALETLPTSIIFDATWAADEAASCRWFAQRATNGNGRYLLSSGNNAAAGGNTNATAGVELSQPEAIAELLAHVRRLAEAEFAQGKAKSGAEQKVVEVSAAIVVPSFCGQRHRLIVLQAARIAGFARVRLVNQSTAAAMAYRQAVSDVGVLGRGRQQQVAVISMGAHSTECSLFRFEPTLSPVLVACGGRVDLGGWHFTARLVDWVFEQLSARNQLRQNLQFVKTVWMCCERAKVDLSLCNNTKITVEPPGSNCDSTFDLSVDQFERICEPLFEKLETLFNEVLSAHISTICRVIFAGGSSRLDWINRVFRKTFGADALVPSTVVVPEEAAVRGASLAAAYLWAPNEDEQKVCFCRSLVPDCIYRQLHFELMINGKDVIFSMEPRSRTDSLPCTFTVYGGGHGRAIKALEDGNVFTDFKFSSSQWSFTIDEDGILSIIGPPMSLPLFDSGGILSQNEEAQALVRAQTYERELQKGRLREEEAKRQREEARKQAREEAALKRRQQQEEARRQKEEAEAKRKMEEAAEEQRRRDEAEAKRKRDEAEVKRKQEKDEAIRRQKAVDEKCRLQKEAEKLAKQPKLPALAVDAEWNVTVRKAPAPKHSPSSSVEQMDCLPSESHADTVFKAANQRQKDQPTSTPHHSSSPLATTMEIKAMAGQRQNGGGGVNGPAASTNPAAAIAAAGGTYSGALQRAAATASKTTTTIGVANALPSSCGMQSANATVGSGGGDIIYHEDCLLVGCIRKDVHSLGDILQIQNIDRTVPLVQHCLSLGKDLIHNSPSGDIRRAYLESLVPAAEVLALLVDVVRSAQRLALIVLNNRKESGIFSWKGYDIPKEDVEAVCKNFVSVLQLQNGVLPTKNLLVSKIRRFEYILNSRFWTGITAQGQRLLDGRMNRQFPDRYYEGPSSSGGYSRLGQTN